MRERSRQGGHSRKSRGPEKEETRGSAMGGRNDPPDRGGVTFQKGTRQRLKRGRGSREKTASISDDEEKTGLERRSCTNLQKTAYEIGALGGRKKKGGRPEREEILYGLVRTSS